MENLSKDIKTVLVTKEQIAAKVKEIGAQITKDYEGKDVVLVGILKGAMPFLCDLMRSINLPVTLDTMCVSSYGNSTVSSGHVKIKKDLDKDIRGKHVIVVEDIIDTGITMSNLVPLLRERGAASVELAICLNKKERREADVYVKYVGFEIPDASALRQFSSIFLHPCIEPTHPQNSKLVAKTQYAAFRNTGVKG